jgi:hypothetical protein
MLVEAGVDLSMTTAATLGRTYLGQFGSGSSDNGFKVRLGLEFLGRVGNMWRQHANVRFARDGSVAR